MRGFLRLLAWVTAILAVIGLVLYLAMFDVWVVPSDDPTFSASIAPTLRPLDRVLVLRGGEVKPGNLVRCVDPDAPGRFVVGRIVAQGGEQVDIGEVVVVNNKRNPSPHACTEAHVTMRHPVSGDDVTLQCAAEDTNGVEHDALRDLEHPQASVKSVVESGKVYLASDDRHIHLDSRDFGQVNPQTCQHIVYRLWGDSFFDSSHRFNFIW